MEHLSVMNNYPDSQPEKAELKDSPVLDLEFPAAADFRSLPPRLDPQVMLSRLTETMPWRSTRPGEKERRLQMKVNVPFLL